MTLVLHEWFFFSLLICLHFFLNFTSHTHTHTHTMSNKRTILNLFVNYIDFPVTGPNIFDAFQRQSVFDKYRRINIKINCCLLVTVKVICFNKFAANSQVQPYLIKKGLLIALVFYPTRWFYWLIGHLIKVEVIREINIWSIIHNQQVMILIMDVVLIMVLINGEDTILRTFSVLIA